MPAAEIIAIGPAVFFGGAQRRDGLCDGLGGYIFHRSSRVQGTGCWLLVTGYWVLGTGYWILDTGYWVLDTGYWVLGTGYWIPNTDIVDWLSGCNYGFIPNLQNNWTLHVFNNRNILK